MIKYKYYSRYDDDELRVLDEITKAGFDMDLETYLSYVLKQLLLTGRNHGGKIKGLTEEKVRAVREILRKQHFQWHDLTATKLYKHEIVLDTAITAKDLTLLDHMLSRNFFGINYVFDFALMQLINLNIYDYQIPYSKASSVNVAYGLASFRLDKTKHQYALEFKEAMKHAHEIRKD